MKIPTPRNQGYNGGYGGVGSKPSPKVWTPGTKGRRARTRVPRRFRHIRLRRTKRSRMEPMSVAGGIVLTAILLGLAFLFLVMTRS